MQIKAPIPAPGRVIAIESGRLLLMPVRKLLTSPMMDSFAVVRVPVQSKWVQVEFRLLPNRTKPCTTRIVVRTDALLDADAVVSSAAPLLYVGDPVFFFTSIESRKGVYERAIRCCDPQKYVGSFRTDSGEIAACIRVGARSAAYRLTESPSDGKNLKFELVLEVIDEVELG